MNIGKLLSIGSAVVGAGLLIMKMKNQTAEEHEAAEIANAVKEADPNNEDYIDRGGGQIPAGADPRVFRTAGGNAADAQAYQYAANANNAADALKAQYPGIEGVIRNWIRYSNHSTASTLKSGLPYHINLSKEDRFKTQNPDRYNYAKAINYNLATVLKHAKTLGLIDSAGKVTYAPSPR